MYGFAGGFGITGEFARRQQIERQINLNMITAGSHRLFAHKAYKANKAMKIMLLYFQTIAFQNSVFEWARDHRWDNMK